MSGPPDIGIGIMGRSVTSQSVLVVKTASKDVSLRAGPRHWDPTNKAYAYAQVIGQVKKGQSVKVGGDSILSRGGTSIWSPISAVISDLNRTK